MFKSARSNALARRSTGARSAGVAALVALPLLAACNSNSSSPSSAAPSTSTGVAATGAPTTSNQLTSLKFSFNPTLFIAWPVYVAQQEGFFQRNGINANLVQVTGGGSIIAAGLASGSIDVVSNSDLSLMGPYLAKGQNFVCVAGDAAAGWSIIGRTGNGIAANSLAAIQALKGKTIGIVAVGSASYYVMRAILTDAGVNPDEVKYAALGAAPASAVAALEANRVAAVASLADGAFFLSHQPGFSYIFNAAAIPSGLNNASLLSSISSQPNTSVWVRGTYAKAHPQVIASLQEALQESSAWMHDPKNLTALVTLLSNGHLPSYASANPTQFVTTVLPVLQTTYPSSDAQSDMSFWVSTGLLKKAIPLSQWYDAQG